MAAAAVYVITAEDIRRSGAQTLPELLRDVPGLSVARVNSSTWAISARGFSSTLSDKLEILLDGRTLYTPLFSGVFWDQQGYALEDIERIEVIRGPGGVPAGAHVLTVGEGRAFVEAGGMIGFTIVDDRVRFITCPSCTAYCQ